MSPELAGLHEVAQLLDVPKRTATRYVERLDFPAPIERLAAGPVWRIADVERWKAESLPLRTGRPSAEVDRIAEQLERLEAAGGQVDDAQAVGVLDFRDGRVRVVSRSAPFNCVAEPAAVLERLGQLADGAGPQAVWAALEPLLAFPEP